MPQHSEDIDEGISLFYRDISWEVRIFFSAIGPEDEKRTCSPLASGATATLRLPSLFCPLPFAIDPEDEKRTRGGIAGGRVHTLHLSLLFSVLCYISYYEIEELECQTPLTAP